MRVFLIDCELSGQSEPFRKEGFAGAFVTCIVANDDIVAAINDALEALKEDRYIVVDTDKALRFEADDWAHDDEFRKIVSEVSKDGQLRYSEFNVWGH